MKDEIKKLEARIELLERAIVLLWKTKVGSSGCDAEDDSALDSIVLDLECGEEK